jgi:hypothetical protein
MTPISAGRHESISATFGVAPFSGVDVFFGPAEKSMGVILVVLFLVLPAWRTTSNGEGVFFGAKQMFVEGYVAVFFDSERRPSGSDVLCLVPRRGRISGGMAFFSAEERSMKYTFRPFFSISSRSPLKEGE